MAPNTTTSLLQLVTAGLTPAVMISADAVLIMGVNQKHAALADRLRTLAAEYRAPNTSPERKQAIRAQVHLFARRFAYAAAAHLWLYVAVSCFVGMALVITLTSGNPPWDRAALGLFVAGIALTLGAVVTEMRELRLAGQTVRLEIDDLLGEAGVKG